MDYTTVQTPNYQQSAPSHTMSDRFQMVWFDFGNMTKNKVIKRSIYLFALILHVLQAAHFTSFNVDVIFVFVLMHINKSDEGK